MFRYNWNFPITVPNLPVWGTHMMGHSVFLLTRLIFWWCKLKTKWEGLSDSVEQINAKTDEEMKYEGEGKKRWMNHKIPDWFQTAKEGLKGAALSFWKIQIALMCIGWEMRQGAIYNIYCLALFLYLQPDHLEMLFQSSVGRLWCMWMFPRRIKLSLKHSEKQLWEIPLLGWFLRLLTTGDFLFSFLTLRSFFV